MKIDPFYATNIVRLYRRHVDFYAWKGIPVARKWPKYTKRPDTPKQKAAKDRIKKMWIYMRQQPDAWIAAWNKATIPKSMSAEDVRRGVVYNIIRYQDVGDIPTLRGVTIDYDFKSNLTICVAWWNPVVYRFRNPVQEIAHYRWADWHPKESTYYDFCIRTRTLGVIMKYKTYTYKEIPIKKQVWRWDIGWVETHLLGYHRELHVVPFNAYEKII